MGGSRVMCCGDSITCGVPTFTGGYRRPLANFAPGMVFVGSLVFNITNGTYTVGQHEGYSGKNVAYLTAHSLPQADVYLPDLILLMIGTNDIGQGIAPATAAASVVTLAQAYLEKASVSKVVVSTVPPRRSSDTYYQATIDFNADLVADFASPPAGIYFYDCCQDLVQPGDFANLLHPNDGGYAKIAKRWIDAFRIAGVNFGSDMPSSSGVSWLY